MKKVKYYYSEAVHIRLMPVATDAEGDPLYILGSKPVKVKVIPRITVATVWDTKTDTMTFGTAICSPKDTFVKAVGRDIALKCATVKPEITVKLTKKNKVRETSKRYANQLISQHLEKYVFTEV